MTLLDGKKLSQKIQEDIKSEVKDLIDQGVTPSLAVIVVGDDAASLTYVEMKAKACKSVGIISIKYQMPSSITQKDLLYTIDSLNDNKNLDGILVQLPLPAHLNKDEILDRISPSKDVDGFNSQNSGKLHSALSGFIPATPLGVMTLLKHYNIDIKGRDVTIIGASNIVGKPLSALMLNAGATISVCHIFTKDLAKYTRDADIICVGVGKRDILDSSMVKKGCIVIDIGINKIIDETGKSKIVGDCNFDSLKEVCSYITPVPGGVGPMTIVSLLQNTINSAKARLLLK